MVILFDSLMPLFCSARVSANICGLLLLCCGNTVRVNRLVSSAVAPVRDKQHMVAMGEGREVCDFLP